MVSPALTAQAIERGCHLGVSDTSPHTGETAVERGSLTFTPLPRTTEKKLLTKKLLVVTKSFFCVIISVYNLCYLVTAFSSTVGIGCNGLRQMQTYRLDYRELLH